MLCCYSKIINSGSVWGSGLAVTAPKLILFPRIGTSWSVLSVLQYAHGTKDKLTRHSSETFKVRSYFWSINGYDYVINRVVFTYFKTGFKWHSKGLFWVYFQPDRGETGETRLCFRRTPPRFHNSRVTSESVVTSEVWTLMCGISVLNSHPNRAELDSELLYL